MNRGSLRCAFGGEAVPADERKLARAGTRCPRAPDRTLVTCRAHLHAVDCGDVATVLGPLPPHAFHSAPSLLYSGCFVVMCRRSCTNDRLQHGHTPLPTRCLSFVISPFRPAFARLNVSM